MALNFSIGENPVLDCDLSGWPEVERRKFQSDAAQIEGVVRSGGAGISTVRIWHSSEVDRNVLSTKLTELANGTLPGYQFSC